MNSWDRGLFANCEKSLAGDQGGDSCYNWLDSSSRREAYGSQHDQSHLNDRCRGDVRGPRGCGTDVGRGGSSTADKPTPSARSAGPELGIGMPAFDRIMTDALKARNIPGGRWPSSRTANWSLPAAMGWPTSRRRNRSPWRRSFPAPASPRPSPQPPCCDWSTKESYRWTIRSMPCWASRVRWATRRSIRWRRKSPCGNSCCMRPAGTRNCTPTPCGRRRRSRG